MLIFRKNSNFSMHSKFILLNFTQNHFQTIFGKKIFKQLTRIIKSDKIDKCRFLTKSSVKIVTKKIFTSNHCLP